jgi:hypothetical protein
MSALRASSFLSRSFSIAGIVSRGLYKTCVADRSAVAGFPAKKTNGAILTASSRVVGSSGINDVAAGGHLAHFTMPLAKQEVTTWRTSPVSKRRPLAKQ